MTGIVFETIATGHEKQSDRRKLSVFSLLQHYVPHFGRFDQTIPDVAPLRLEAHIASDVMTSNPVSIREELTVHEAVVFLTERKISAAPVINQAGRPVGVVSEADILRHDREHAKRVLDPQRKPVVN
jgi:predicted transcriptional regulator